MTEKQLGAAPSTSADIATKAYADLNVSPVNTQQDTILTASLEHLANNILEIGASYFLEIPSTSTLEVWAVGKSGVPQGTGTVVGSGFKATRVNTAAISSSAGSQILPGSFYDTPVYCTLDITSTPGANNQVSLSVAGWYAVRVSFIVNGAATGAPCFYRNGTLVEVGTLINTGQITIINLCETFLIYCAAGDTLAPGINGAFGAKGEATGTQCVWSVSLMNCGTLS